MHQYSNISVKYYSLYLTETTQLFIKYGGFLTGMGNVNSNTKLVLSRWMKFLVPASMSTKERRKVAARAGVSDETLRSSIRRQAINGDTLIRLFLARGISVQYLLELQQTERSAMSRGESLWAEVGLELSEVEKAEFAEIVRYLRDRFWRMAEK